MKPLTLSIDLDEEVQHLTQYLTNTWTPIEHLNTIVSTTAQAALNAARGWFDGLTVQLRCHELRKHREALLAAHTGPALSSLATSYDDCCCLLTSINFEAGLLAEAGLELDGPWDFSRRVSALTSTLLSQHPALAEARPFGWDALAAHYRDFDGMEEFDARAARLAFGGVEIAEARAPSFPTSVALPHVMYDHFCQNRKPAHVLVGAVFGHFLGIQRFLNTQRILGDLPLALHRLTTPKVCFERVAASSNPFLKLCLAQAPEPHTEAQYQEAVTKAEAFQASSPEAQAEAEKVKQARVREILRALAEEDSAQGQETRQAEHAQRIALLREALDPA